jgi:hypothetical protein
MQTSDIHNLIATEESPLSPAWRIKGVADLSRASQEPARRLLCLSLNTWLPASNPDVQGTVFVESQDGNVDQFTQTECDFATPTMVAVMPPVSTLNG